MPVNEGYGMVLRILMFGSTPAFSLRCRVSYALFGSMFGVLNKLPVIFDPGFVDTEGDGINTTLAVKNGNLNELHLQAINKLDRGVVSE